MCFLTVALVPESSTSSDRFAATIAIVVSMQTPNEVAVKSVGLKAAPFPRLSVGASVFKELRDGPWTERQCRSPWYSTEISTIPKIIALHFFESAKKPETSL